MLGWVFHPMMEVSMYEVLGVEGLCRTKKGASTNCLHIMHSAYKYIEMILFFGTAVAVIKAGNTKEKRNSVSVWSLYKFTVILQSTSMIQIPFPQSDLSPVLFLQHKAITSTYR